MAGLLLGWAELGWISANNLNKPPMPNRLLVRGLKFGPVLTCPSSTGDRPHREPQKINRTLSWSCRAGSAVLARPKSSDVVVPS